MVKLDKDFWLALRREMFDDNFDGGWFLEEWVEAAAEKLDSLNIESVKIVYCEIEENLNPYHMWVKYKDSSTSREMIADGSAGIFDKSYPLGFYGTIDSVIGRLHEIYSSGEEVQEMKKKGLLNRIYG